MKILSRKIAYECPVLRVEERQVKIGDGPEQTHWVVVRQPNISVVGLTVGKKIVLTREAVGKDDRMVLGLPSGKMHDWNPTAEQIKNEALIELETEAGYKAKSIELLRVHEVMTGYFERQYHQFVAWDLEHVGQKLESGELVDVVLADADQALAFAEDGSIEFSHEAGAVKLAIEWFKKKGLL